MAMTVKQKAKWFVDELEKAYPDAVCSLDYHKAYELLISVRLAAQCTDARVNLVTQDLFVEYPTLQSFADAEPSLLADSIRSCGLGNTKARDIVAMANMLINEYGGIVPDDLDTLLKLPGVGRKTANLIVGDVYGKPAVVCDTHCIRITNLLGLSDSKNPDKVERQLRNVLPMERANDFCHRLVLHGRAVCRARSPQCGICRLRLHCPHGQKAI